MIILSKTLIYFGLLCCSGSIVLFEFKDRYKNIDCWQIVLMIIAILAIIIGILII